MDIFPILEMNLYEPQDKFYFPVTYITVDDLEAAGIDTSNVNDEMMKKTARCLEAHILEKGIFDVLERDALLLGLKKKEK